MANKTIELPQPAEIADDIRGAAKDMAALYINGDIKIGDVIEALRKTKLEPLEASYFMLIFVVGLPRGHDREVTRALAAVARNAHDLAR